MSKEINKMKREIKKKINNYSKKEAVAYFFGMCDGTNLQLQYRIEELK